MSTPSSSAVDPRRPGPVAPAHTGQLTAGDCTTLYFEWFVASGEPQGVVVVTHGYAEHCGRFHELAHVLLLAGWSVLTYDVRGHGASSGQRGFVRHFGDYLGDLGLMIAEGRRRQPTGKLVLLGHSNGGLITLRAMCEGNAPAPDRLILSSPFLGMRLKVGRAKKGLARIASAVYPKLSLPNELTSDQLSSDPAMQAAHDADPTCFHVATARWFTEAMAAQDVVARRLTRLACPSLWITGSADPIADPVATRRVAEAITGAQLHELAGFRHEVFNELERQRAFGLVVDFLAVP